MSVAGMGRTAETEFYRSLSQIARDPEGFEKRIANLEDMTAKANDAATKAATQIDLAAAMTKKAEAQMAEAERARQHADEYAEAAKKEAARFTAKANAEIETAQQRLAVDTQVLSVRKSEIDKIEADLKSRLTQLDSARATYEASTADNTKLNIALKTAIEAVNVRERSAHDTIAKLRAALPGG